MANYLGYITITPQVLFGEIENTRFEGYNSPQTIVIDVTPPEVENWSLVGEFASDAVIEFDIPGEVSAVFVTVHIGYPDKPRLAETIWDGEAFTDFYEPLSDMVQSVDANMHFSMARVGGWPSYPLRFRIKAVDKRGNLS